MKTGIESSNSNFLIPIYLCNPMLKSLDNSNYEFC